MLGGIGFTGSQSAEIKSRTTQIETRRENYKEYKKYDENKTIQMLLSEISRERDQRTITP